MDFQAKAMMMAVMASKPFSVGFHIPGQSLLRKARNPASGAIMKRKASASAGAAMA